MSKSKELEDWMQEGSSVTGISALSMFGIYRLSSVIHRFRQRGYSIVTFRVGKERYAVYRMACNACNSTAKELRNYARGVMLCPSCYKKAKDGEDNEANNASHK